MKKTLTLLMLLCMVCTGAWAVVQPETGKLFKMHCAATSGHTDRRYIQIATNENISHQSSRGSYFVFEARSEGEWYIKDAGSGKYLVVANTSNNTPVTLSETASTYWTTTNQSDGIRFLPNGTSGIFLNNRDRLGLLDGTGGCSSWVLEEQADVAKGATSADAITTGWYKIELGDGTGASHAAHKGKYITGKVTIYNNNNWGMSFSQDPDNDPSAWIYVEKGTGDNYTFTFNKGTRNEYTIGQNSVVNTTAGNFTFGAQRAETDNFQFTIRGGNNRIVGYTLSGLDFVGNTTTDNQANNTCYYVFHKVEAPQITEVEYTYKCNGVDDAVVYATQTNGSDFAAPVVPPFGEVVSIESEGTVSATNYTCIVNYTQTLPFVLGNVYYLGDRLHKTGDNTGNIQYYSYGDAADKKAPSRAGSPVCAKNYMWTFERVANTFDQFYLKNLEFGYVSTADGNSQQSVLGESKTAMKLYEYTGAGHQSGNKDFGFTDAAVPANVFGDHASSHLGYWKVGDTENEGSALRIVDVDFDVLPTAYTTPDEQHAGYITQIVHYDSEKVATAKAQPTVDNVVALFESKVCALDANKYYRILDYLNRDVNAGPDANAEGTAIDSNRNIKTNNNITNATSLWQFEEISGNYYVKHMNSGLYIGQPSSGSAVALPLEKRYAGIFAVTENNTDPYKHTLVRSGVYLNTNNQINEVHGWGADGDGSRWYIVEAKTVPVTVSSVGYTTVNFPVAVTIPAEVKAYKVTADNETSMTLEEVTGNVPANTALIIKASENTYNFTIVSSGTAQNDNKLQGTTARRTDFGVNSFYALAADNESALGVSFKINSASVTAIPANKAFLPVTTTSPTQALYFDFGGITTGIESTSLLPNADALYNLQGQPVNQPSRGIYVKANGQKVFIK